jgi:hypothetical protein
MMRIGKIVKSNSHVDYVGRVLDKLEADSPPNPEHYRFGQFVAIPPISRAFSSPADSIGSNGGPGRACTTVGIIYNSQLVNPDYERLGPRLSAPVELTTVFSPDLLNEQGVLIGVLLVGWEDASGGWRQGIPRPVLPVNSDIIAMSDEEVRAFHVNGGNRLAIHYYPHVMTHARQFGQQLLLSVLDQLQALCGDVSSSEIALLRRTLNWQIVFQNKSL